MQQQQHRLQQLRPSPSAAAALRPRHVAAHAHARPVVAAPPAEHRRGASLCTAPVAPHHHAAARRATAPAAPPRRKHPVGAAAWTACRSSFLPSQATTPEPIPDDVQLELDPDAGAKEVTYNEATKTVRIPLSALGDGDGAGKQRRTKMVMFSCNKCGGRSARLVNPVAWDKGAVFCQCQHCDVWHMLRADKSIVEEIRFNQPQWEQAPALEEAQQQQQQGGGGSAAAAAAASEASSDTGLALGDGGSEGEVTSRG